MALIDLLRRLVVARGKVDQLSCSGELAIEELVALDFWDQAELALAVANENLTHVTLSGTRAIQAVVDCPLIVVETNVGSLRALIGHATLETVVVEPGTASDIPAGFEAEVIERLGKSAGDWLWDLV